MDSNQRRLSRRSCFYGCGTGAGKTNRAFLTVLTAAVQPAVRLSVLPVRLDPASAGYDPAWHQATLALLAVAGAEVIPVDNGTSGLSRFAGLDSFRAASASAAAAISLLLTGAPRGLIVAFDVP